MAIEDDCFQRSVVASGPPIHLSASSTLDVATSSLVIKVGHGSPMSHTKIPGEVNFIAVKWSQNVVDLEILFHKRN